jgi:hypothetical protein
MSIRSDFEDAAVAYLRAHTAWKEAPDGPPKVATKTAMKTAHGKLLSMTKLFVPQYEKKLPER